MIKNNWNRLITYGLIAIVCCFAGLAFDQLKPYCLLIIAIYPTITRLLGFPLFSIKDKHN